MPDAKKQKKLFTFLYSFFKKLVHKIVCKICKYEMT